jgi:hypothetical protein
MYKRLPKEWKAIADAHIKARETQNFDNPHVSTESEFYTAVKAGKTFASLLETVETRYCSMTSILTACLISHTSEAYKKGVYRGFLKIANEESLINKQ